MFARTPRLTLRPGWPEDATELTRAIGHEGVVKMLVRAPWPYGESDAAQFLGQPKGGETPDFVILSHETNQPRIVGGIGMRAEEHGHEFGYWLTPDAWGRGYATEAGRAVIDMARHALGIRHLYAGHFVDNPASGRVLTKLGFRPTGRVEQRESRGRGGTVPCALFELDLDVARAMPLAA